MGGKVNSLLGAVVDAGWCEQPGMLAYFCDLHSIPVVY